MAYKPSNPNGQNTMANSEPVVIASNQSAIPVSGTFWQTTQPVSLASVPTHGVTGTFWQTTQPVSIASMPSTPVTGTFWQATQPVSLTSTTITGSVTVTGPLTDTQIRATALPVSLASVPSHAVTLTSTTITGSVAVTDNAGSLTVDAPVATPVYVRLSDGAAAITTLPVSIASMPSTPVTGTFWQTTQPVSLASVPSHPVTLASTTITGSVAVTGSFWQATQPVSGPLTDTQLRATAVPVSGTVTANAGSGNFTVTQATASNLNATVTGTVELGATSLAALENISVTIPGTVDLGTVSLTALETITVTSATASNFLNKPYGSVTTAAPAYTTGTDNALSLTTSGALRVDSSATTQPVSIASMPSTPVTGTFWQATQPVSGTVEIGATSLAALETTNAVQSGTWNIGSITTLPSLATGANVIGAVTQSGAWTVTTAAADTHDGAAGTIGQMQVGYASSTAQTAVQAGDAARLWTTLNGALNIADAGGSITVDGTFWQATQPVSLASVPTHAVTLTSTTITGSVAVTGPLTDTQLRATALPVSIASMPSTPVTGTFYQATQPVSLASVPTHGVTGTFWQTTQPVSLASVPSHAVTLTSTTLTSVVPGVGATNLGKQTDSAAGATDTGVAVLAIRADTLATLTPIVGDYTRFRVNSVGRLWASATIDAALPAGTNAIGSITNTSFDATQSGTWNIGSVTTMPTTPVTGTFWQTTQPVSLASVPTHGVTGTFWQATQPVSLASVPTHAVTQSGTWTVTTAAADTHDLAAGTIGQMSVGYASSTAPVAVAAGDAARIWTTLNGALNIADGGSTISIDDGAGSITVDGTFWQTTQPVSIASMPSTPVTGTFWQTTQPVSLASVPTHGVTGTFWQATQPVSLASVPTHAVTQSGAWTVTTTANDTHDLVSGTTGQMQVGYAYGVSPADNALPSISTNADAARMLVNKNGALVAVHLPEATQAYAPTNATTTAYAASIIAKATAGTLYMITGYNSGPDQFMQIHDSATLPANAAVPKVIFLVPAASNFSYDLGNYGRYFAAGITICNSTTGPTKTIGAANCWIDVQYK